MGLNTQRKLFIEEHIRLRFKNATQAAINAGYSEKSAQSQASQILKDANVIKYLETRKREIVEGIQQDFYFDALEARKVMYDIMKNSNARDTDRLNAAKDLLDRAGYKPTEKVEVSKSTDEAIAEMEQYLCAKKKEDT